MAIKATEINDDLLIVQIVQVVGRLGLSMAGAMCGTFVAAQLTMTNAEIFDSATFIALMVLVGLFGESMSRIRALRWQAPSLNAQGLIRPSCFQRSARSLPPSQR